ncbi:MAG: iron ABC transporter permease [Lachnospiraceae bacterium]|nr:iron ABC transporter permease [Lachnospiraceae bacterium]
MNQFAEKSEGRSIYSAINWKRRIVLAFTIAAVLALGIVDMSIGSSNLTFRECVRILLQGPGVKGTYELIVWRVRLPMTLTCVGVGGCLALSGLQVQTITNNPLASPYTLGISSGASFGAAIAIVTGISIFGFQWIGTAAIAFAFALFVTLMIFFLGKMKGMSAHTLVLVGIIMNFFFSALQQYLQYRASAEIAQIISNWSFGNLARASWTSAIVGIAVTFAGVIYFARLSWKLTAFTAGEERALSLGIPVESLKMQVFTASALLIATGVGFIGTVGFVGLVAPHCARMLVGEDQRYLMPVSTLFGILVMLAASTVSKLMTQGSMLPVGIVTSIVGVPFLFVLLMREVR